LGLGNDYAIFADARIGEGGRLYAVGDIHGCAEELEALLEFLITKEGVTGDDLIVFLGDYVDRGNDSKKVVQQLIEFQRLSTRTKFLLGNHEVLFLKFIAGMEEQEFEHYVSCGGLSTLTSYGLNYEMSTEEKVKIVAPHLKFFRTLELGLYVDNFLFVHAGIRPTSPLFQQRLDDVLWIREDFLGSPTILGCTVVFGHTPFREIYYDVPYRIGVDTGLVYGGKLSCLELLSGRYFEIVRNSEKVVTKIIKR
jgi:serine/threonine protein phosphatase 1